MMEADLKKFKRTKQKLSQKYKEECIQTLKREPPLYLVNSIRDKTIALELDLFHNEDLLFFSVLIRLPINKIYLYCQQNKKQPGSNSAPIYESSKFKDMLKDIANVIYESQSLKSLIFQRIPLSIKSILILKQSISNTQCLKELSFRECNLSDEHLSIIKSGIAKNQSLVILDLSKNKLCNVGSMIGKIMSDHNLRRDQLIWLASLRGESLDDDLSKKGICEVNLQNNALEDKSALELIQFLKNDQWSRCINLRNNKLSVEGIREFARLMKKNSTIISLDLRGNPGLTKQYSLYILKKLKQNIQKYREEKARYQSKKQNENQHEDLLPLPNNQHKSLEQKRKQGPTKKTEERQRLEFNNITSMNNKSNKNVQDKSEIVGDENCCRKCRRNTLDMLKLQKNNLDLQIEIKKLRNILLTKNIDISAILPHQHHNTIIQNPTQVNQSFNRAVQLSTNVNNAQTDEDLIIRVEQIMLELTKIMDNIDTHQNTQINISNNNISAANSLSRTIPLFAHPSEMEQLEQSSIQQKENDSNVARLSSQQLIN